MAGSELFPDVSVYGGMKMRTTNQRAAEERAELYYAAHPGSPSAVRRPKLSIRSGMWIALLGRNIQEGIAGLGPTVERALRAFDLQYLAALHGRDA